jgi:hypothetical protein
VLARRIVVVAPDKVFGKQVAVALRAAGGTVDLHQTLAELGTGELQAALVVVHFSGELADSAPSLFTRLASDTRVIAILPRTALAPVVDLLQTSERVAGVIIDDTFDAHRLAAMATRVVAGDLFGLEKVMRWGTHIHSQMVGDYPDKTKCISQIGEFAEVMSVRRKYRESIDQCMDEMLMNALYDAPVDEQGRPIFVDIPTKTRIQLKVEQRAVVQYACDGKRFAISVRDAFGTLERATVLQYLYKCLHSEQQIDRKAGGAGLGLYLMVNAASAVYFNVLPKVATEVVCIFDLESPKLQIEEFGFFIEKIDASGRLAVGPAQRVPTGAGFPVERRAAAPAPAPRLPRGVVPILAVAIVAVLALIGVAAWPRLAGGKLQLASVSITTIPKGATIELDGKPAGAASDGVFVAQGLEVGRAYPVVARLDGYQPRQAVVQPRTGTNEVTLELEATAATVRLTSQPAGAHVIAADGKDLGVTPVELTTLPPRGHAKLILRKPGFLDLAEDLSVPGPGKELDIQVALELSGDFARVHLTSDPAGATISHDGERLADLTPATVLVEAGKPQHFTLTLEGRVPAEIPAFTPAAGADVAKAAKLVEGVHLTLSTNATDPKLSVAVVPGCQAAASTLSCLVAPGTYTVEVGGAMGVHIKKTVQVTADATVAIEVGFVEAPEGKKIVIGTAPGVARVALEAGTRTVTVTDDAGSHVATVKVRAGKTTKVE